MNGMDLSSANLDLNSLEACLEPRVYDHIDALYLNNNALTSLPDNFAKRFPNLRWLDIRDNRLESLDNLSLDQNTWCDLVTILAQGNPLKKFPWDLRKLPRLKVLQTDAILGSEMDDSEACKRDEVDSGIGSCLEDESKTWRLRSPSFRIHLTNTGRQDFDGSEDEKASGSQESKEDRLDVIDRMISLEKWSLLPEEWDSMKRSMSSPCVSGSTTMTSSKRKKKRRKIKKKRKTQKVLVHHDPPSFQMSCARSDFAAMVKARADEERKRRANIADNIRIEKILQSRKDKELLKSWRQRQSDPEQTQSRCKDKRMPLPPLGLDRNRHNAIHLSWRDVVDGKVTRGEYEAIMCQLDVEIEAVLSRNLDQIVSIDDEIKASKEEANRIAGEMKKLRLAVAKTSNHVTD